MDKEIKKALIGLASIVIIASAIVGGTYLSKSLGIEKQEKENQQTQSEETQQKLEEAQKQIEELSKKLEEQSKKPIAQTQQPVVTKQQAPPKESSKPKLPPRPTPPEYEDCNKYGTGEPRPGLPPYEIYECAWKNSQKEKDYQQRLREWEKMIESGWTP